MSRIELIYDADCPNVEAARSQLRLALARVGQASNWEEWERSDSAAPPHVRQYGSPTILVDGRDVTGQAAAEGADCCRLYHGENGRFQGVPSAETIAAAVRQAAAADVVAPRASGGLLAWLALIPAFAAAIVPNLVVCQVKEWGSGWLGLSAANPQFFRTGGSLRSTPGTPKSRLDRALACPACWPAYAGLLSSLGLGFVVPFLMQTQYLLPLTVVALLAAVAALGFRARRRRGYGPFLVGLMGAGLMAAGKFVLAESDPAVLGGLALLVGASVWNSWPKPTRSPTCPSCHQREFSPN